jgi:hypothetical protein
MNENLNKFIENIHFSEILVNVGVGVAFMSIFVTIFYYYYVLEIEHQMIRDNISIMTGSLLDSYKPFLSPYTINIIKNKLINSDLSSADKQVSDSNSKIKAESIKSVATISVVMFLFAYLISRYFNINFKNIIINNILLLLLLGFTEYTFLHVVPSKIITGDPNFIKYKIFTNINKKIIFE